MAVGVIARLNVCLFMWLWLGCWSGINSSRHQTRRVQGCTRKWMGEWFTMATSAILPPKREKEKIKTYAIQLTNAATLTLSLLSEKWEFIFAQMDCANSFVLPYLILELRGLDCHSSHKLDLNHKGLSSLLGLLLMQMKKFPLSQWNRCQIADGYHLQFTM